MYDLIIIGAGPAGITAGVYAARKKVDFMVLTGDIGGQAALSGDVENYTGYQFVTGPELAAKFEEHMRKFDFVLKENETATRIVQTDGSAFTVKTDKGAYETRTIIIASGKKSRALNVSGEAEFKNKGVSYCATCDGPIFTGKDVAVIGGGNSALDAATQLMKIARSVYVVNNAPQITGDEVMRDKLIDGKNVTILNNASVVSIIGDKFVSGIRIRQGEKEETLPVQGVFVEVGLIPNTEFAQGIERNASGEIKVNSSNETNIPGIFAAGDATDVPEKQIIIAAGEGAKAALSACRYLARHKFS
ncbi:MAG: FAD-dependent oxidoreductase [Candidatus Omnitrophica bacterium]|nr:FAD-dependent oxidoreductase [Candidatus Omnitrophota bacterium]